VYSGPSPRNLVLSMVLHGAAIAALFQRVDSGGGTGCAFRKRAADRDPDQRQAVLRGAVGWFAERLQRLSTAQRQGSKK